MSVAPMSRKTKRAYLRLCPEKRRKKNLVHKGLRTSIAPTDGLVDSMERA